MKTFELTVISEAKVHFKGRASHCGVTTLSGAIGFEADHEPFVGVLKPGSKIRYTGEEGGEKSLIIQDGMLSFKKNNCTIIISPSEAG